MKKPDLRSLKQNPNQAQKMAEGVDPEAMRQVKSLVDHYQGKSEAELLADLQDTVKKERAAGTMSNARMDSFAQMLGPMLDPSQRQRMQAILEQLKNS